MAGSFTPQERAQMERVGLEQAELKMRQSFEMSMIFNIPGVPGEAGCLMKDELTGIYLDDRIELAFNGFKAGVESVQGKLKRYNPDRWVSPAMAQEFQKQIITVPADESYDALTKFCIRLSLTIAGKWPVQ